MRCDYCGSRAEVVGDSGPELTEKLDALKLREDLRDLDAAWEKYKNSVGERDRQGQLHLPSAGTAFGYLIIGGIATVVGTMYLGVLVSLWWILAVVPVGIWFTRFFWSAELQRVGAFSSMRERYVARRADLVRRIGGRG